MKPLSRREFLKLAGALAASCLLPACTPVSSPTSAAPDATPSAPSVVASPIIPTDIPTATSTSLPTSTPLPPTSSLPTSTPLSPTSTTQPLPEMPTETAEAVVTNVLTADQQQRIYAVAKKYIADNEPAAIQVARSLGYIQGDGHPASVCGPLAAAILRGAGLIDAYIDLHDFWLLDPRPGENLQVIERVFPTDEFTWFQTDQAANKFDFRQYPWQVGDFVYLYAGKGGTFEHMFTVTKVDEQSCPYTVTNFNTPKGFVIEEVMLYDLSQPGVGMIYEWADRQNIKYGLTGFGGFSVWRFKVPVHDPDELERKLAEDIDSILAQSGGTWHVLIQAVVGPRLYTRLSRDELHPASVIKIPIAALFLKSIEKDMAAAPDRALQDGIDGRTYQQLLQSMVVDSEEPAADSLLRAIEQRKLDITKVLESWDMDHTEVVTRRSTVRDLEVLFGGIYSGGFLNPPSRDFLLKLMSEYTSNDDTRLGVLRHLLPDGYHFYNKRGTITADWLDVADCALVTLPTSAGDKAYFIGAFAYQGQKITTYEKLDQAIAQIAQAFWAYASQL